MQALCVAIIVSEGECLGLCLAGSAVIHHPVSYVGMTEMALCGSAEIVEHVLPVVYSFLGSVRAGVNSTRESMDCDMNSIRRS